MARTALELFLVDQTNYFINLQSRKVIAGRGIWWVWHGRGWWACHGLN